MQQTKRNNVVIKKECHSRGMLSGIYNACCYNHKGNLLLNRCVEDPQLQLSGMTPFLTTSRGFTLIELLVVVLIIGILAAVAVPQYQKAVERSKATEAMSMLSSIAKAYQVYYLANGQYATKFDELDVDIPFSGTTKFYPYATDTKSNKDWSFQIENHFNSVVLYAARIDGKYKGAGFAVNFKDPVLSKQLKCFERISTANILFDSTLPEGAYCEQVMQAKKVDETQYSRSYRLP